MDLDIAVVGGGVSGAYCAWRLQQEDSDARIALFEYSDRIGGRLYTVTLPGLPHVKAEVGGMRARADPTDRRAQDEIPHFDIQPQLFMQLARDGLARLFTGVNPAAGQPPREFWVEDVLDNQHLSRAIEDRADHAML